MLQITGKGSVGQMDGAEEVNSTSKHGRGSHWSQIEVEGQGHSLSLILTSSLTNSCVIHIALLPLVADVSSTHALVAPLQPQQPQWRSKLEHSS